MHLPLSDLGSFTTTLSSSQISRGGPEANSRKVPVFRLSHIEHPLKIVRRARFTGKADDRLWPNIGPLIVQHNT